MTNAELANLFFSFVFMLGVATLGYRVVGPFLWKFVTRRGWRGFNIDDMG